MQNDLKVNYTGPFIFTIRDIVYFCRSLFR